MATREENLKKINDRLEKLSDEQIEQVAGGLADELALAGGLAENFSIPYPQKQYPQQIIITKPIPREPSHGRPPTPSPMQ